MTIILQTLKKQQICSADDQNNSEAIAS